MSRTVLRLAELRDSWGVSMLQELMSDVDDLLNDPPAWKRMVQAAEGASAISGRSSQVVSPMRGRYDDRRGLDPRRTFVAVIDQALVRPGRAYLEELRRKSELSGKGGYGRSAAASNDERVEAARCR